MFARQDLLRPSVVSRGFGSRRLVVRGPSIVRLCIADAYRHRRSPRREERQGDHIIFLGCSSTESSSHGLFRGAAAIVAW